MPRVLNPLVSNAPYFFIAVGVVWLGIALISSSPLIAWPVIACVAAGIMLRQIPSHRLTSAWVVATAALGFFIAIYQVYAWAGFLGGTFSSLAASAFGGFAVLAAVHVLLFYAGVSKPSGSEKAA